MLGRWFIIGCFMLSLAPNARTAESAPSASDKRDTINIIRVALSKSIREFELPKASHAEENCKYLQSIFDPKLIKHDGKFCSAGGNVNPRFPSIGDEDMSEFARDGRLPKSKIVAGSVNGSAAVVKVLAPIDKDLPQGRVVYFLTKTEQGWRISNLLSYYTWPLDLSGEFRECKGLVGPTYKFAITPRGPDELEDLPEPCKRGSLDAYNRNGWGK